MALFLNAFADWLYVRQQVIAEKAKEETAQIGKIKQFAPDMLEPILDTIKDHNPLDVAFQWYDEERAKGKKVNLQSVADRSGYNLSKVEKASADRNAARKTKSESLQQNETK
jgi:hypothetical protein